MNLPTIQHHTTPQCMICIIQSTVSTEVCMDITHIHTYSTIWRITLIASTMWIIMIIMTPTIKIWNGSDIRPSGNTIQINLTTLKKLVMLISIMMSTLTIALTILIIMMCTFIMWIQWYIMKLYTTMFTIIMTYIIMSHPMSTRCTMMFTMQHHTTITKSFTMKLCIQSSTITTKSTSMAVKLSNHMLNSMTMETTMSTHPSTIRL